MHLTRKPEYLAPMEALVTWGQFYALIEPHYPNKYREVCHVPPRHPVCPCPVRLAGEEAVQRLGAIRRVSSGHGLADLLTILNIPPKTHP